MRIRIHWTTSVQRPDIPVDRAALVLSTLLAPGSLAAFSMAFWKMAAESRIVTRFFITEGTFSHWQVWLLAALLSSASLTVLDRVAHRGRQSVS